MNRLPVLPMSMNLTCPKTLCVCVLLAAIQTMRAILPGFTRCGEHLVSYMTGEDGWHLQLWSFDPGRRCKRLYNVPLFVPSTEEGATEAYLLPA